MSKPTTIVAPGLILVALMLLGGCASSPASADDGFQPRNYEFVETSLAVRNALSFCEPSRAFGCIERVACDAQFPAQEKSVSVSYQMVAGVDRITVVVEPTGYVSEIRRKMVAYNGSVSHSSTPCAENALAVARQ